MNSIRTQLILFASFLVLLVGGSISAYSIFQQQRGVLAAYIAETKTNVTTLSDVVLDDLYLINMSNMRKILHSIKANSSVLHAYIADSKKRIITDGTRENQNMGFPIIKFVDPVLFEFSEIDTFIVNNHLLVGGPIYTADNSLIGYIAVTFNLDNLWQTVRHTTTSSLVITGVSLLLGVMLSVWYASRLSRPISQLADFAGRIGSGEFSSRISLNRRDEIQILAESINRMAENLDDYTSRLEEARVRAEEGSRAKSEFLANTSHEIRTPLNAVASLADLLLRSRLNEQQRQDAEIIRSEVFSLRSIIDEILDFSKIEAGQITIKNELFELRATLEKIVKPLHAICETRDLALISEFDSALPEQVRGDPFRIAQVMKNLLGNSTKFIKRENGGAIVFYVRIERSYQEHVDVHFAVADTGIGIPAEKTELIFESFQQVDGSTTREYGGTGLGLAISKQLVEMMNGTITFNSIPGVGTAFHVVLPLGVEREERPAHVCTKLPPRRPSPGGLRHILLVEDDTLNQTVIKRMLEQSGYAVTVAGNGKDGIEKLATTYFDIVLMDFHMPEMNGVEASQKIRSAKKPYSHVPIIALTAHAIKGVEEKCLSAGMNGFVSKPIEYDRLLSLIEHLSPAL